MTWCWKWPAGRGGSPPPGGGAPHLHHHHHHHHHNNNNNNVYNHCMYIYDNYNSFNINYNNY